MSLTFSSEMDRHRGKRRMYLAFLSLTDETAPSLGASWATSARKYLA